MPRIILKNKPLVEAIFELRWELPSGKAQDEKSPNFKILIGRIYEKVKDEYPHFEQLEAAMLPDQMAGHMVQYRFRKGEGKWPLIQLGPGIITLNDTEGYDWEDFEKRIASTIKILYSTVLSTDRLKIQNALLRHIDAVHFNFEKDNIWHFLKNKMKIDINICPSLFEKTGVQDRPSNFNLRFSFPCEKPTGRVDLRFAKGQRSNKDAIIWETRVQSAGEECPKDKKEIAAWVKQSHKLSDDWFFKIIEGDLFERFK